MYLDNAKRLFIHDNWSFEIYNVPWWYKTYWRVILEGSGNDIYNNNIDTCTNCFCT